MASENRDKQRNENAEGNETPNEADRDTDSKTAKERLNTPRISTRRVGSVDVPFPRYQTDGAAGMDLHAALTAPVTLSPLGRVKVPTGLAFAIPRGLEGQVRPRSGLAAKHGVTVLNSPGTIDSDYRGEVAVVLVNLGSEPVTIAPLDRIAQIVFARHETVVLDEVETLEETERGAGGYGSTGM